MYQEETIEEGFVQPRGPGTFAKKFLSDDSKIGSIVGPTQLGKTAACIEMISVAMEENIPVIVSCDNKIDQLAQFYDRVQYAYKHKDYILLKVSETKFLKEFKSHFEESRQIIIFCLDNNTQIKKVSDAFEEIIPVLKNNKEFGPLNKLCIIHDEGDTTNKDSNVTTISPVQAKSHQAWINCSNMFSAHHINLKRLFVTATPDNVLFKYDVDHIFLLPVPGSYIGCENIQFQTMNSTSEIDIDDILRVEIQRRKNDHESGIILYCIDRRIEEGHIDIFNHVSEMVNDDAIVNTYNGEGIRAKIPADKYRSFKSVCKSYMNRDRKLKVDFNDDTKICTFNNISIARFYQICKRSNNKIIITIGMDLMARGISFVSEEKSSDAIAATTLIYKPGKTMHAVGICQAIGRLCGTARPELVRRLYASDDIISTYRKYIANQKKYLDIIKDNDKMTKLYMAELEFDNKLERKLDKPNLKLNPKYRTETPAPTNVSEGNEIDGVDLVKLRESYHDSNIIIRRMIRFLYNAEIDITFEDFKSGAGYDGTDEGFLSQISNGSGKHSGKLWSTINGKIRMNPKIRKYISENKIASLSK